MRSPCLAERNETEKILRTPENRNLFKFKNTPTKPIDDAFSMSPVPYPLTFTYKISKHFFRLHHKNFLCNGRLSNSVLFNSPRKMPRKIPKVPFKVLDAPQLQDDFYLNLVDWSSANVLSVGLNNCVYLWSACTSRVTKLCDLGLSLLQQTFFYIPQLHTTSKHFFVDHCVIVCFTAVL